MKNVLVRLLGALLLAVLAACSLPPEKPVTRAELMSTRIYNLYIIDESPEQVLNALNSEGEVILESKRNIPGKNYPVYLKLLATSEGIDVLPYDR
ncbi:lipoprotein [Desulfuromonas versatilis]|uniref:Lipoprotein n=1 Tax=Desulfuromonas versatilis TaxID=2802975 RepID=A0ABM8HW42_9BACT|nr:hypothetical protein [Desulfuromonas versatilis]BCR05336.1 lipoprotein [Desulfuromonas versatilis]